MTIKIYHQNPHVGRALQAMILGIICELGLPQMKVEYSIDTRDNLDATPFIVVDRSRKQSKKQNNEEKRRGEHARTTTIHLLKKLRARVKTSPEHIYIETPVHREGIKKILRNSLTRDRSKQTYISSSSTTEQDR